MLRKLQAISSSTSSTLSTTTSVTITTAPSPIITPATTTQSSTDNIYPSNSVYESISPYPSWSTTSNFSPLPSYSSSPTTLIRPVSTPSTNFMDQEISIQGKYILAVMIPIGIIIIFLIICVNRLDSKNRSLEYDLNKKSIINHTSPVYPVGRSNVRSIVSM
jgi:hypothetical protein